MLTLRQRWLLVAVVAAGSQIAGFGTYFGLCALLGGHCRLEWPTVQTARLP